MTNPNPSISIIIATFNRATLLDECLTHMSRLHFCPGDEVIVVDNGSSDATADVIAGHAGNFPVPVRQLHEERPGKSHALGCGLGAARGDVLAFTDDDVCVNSGWLDEVRRVMAAGDIGLVGGPVIPRWERGAPGWLQLTDDSYGRLASPLALLNYGPCREDLGGRTVLGANMAVRRDVLAHVGGFATHLGKLRGTLLSGEDHELCRRVQRAGYRAVYEPRAVVRHWVPADRMRVRYFLNWFYWSGITNAALDETGPRVTRKLLGVPAYLIRRAIAAIGRMAGAAALGRFGRVVDYAIDVAFVIGYAAKRWGFVVLERPAAQRARGAA